MGAERKAVASDIPFTIEEVRENLIQFHKICNKIFADKKKYKDLFYTEEEIKKLKSDPKKCEELHIKFI